MALEGAQRRRVKTVILDVTGIKSVDSQIANTLVRCARALRLLGSEASLCGLRGEVAQAFAALDVDLSALTMKATLQNAIADALKRA